MNLDDDELEIALMALWHLRTNATNQADGTNYERQVGGAAWRCCKHVVAKCDKLITRIEQHKKDQEEEVDA